MATTTESRGTRITLRDDGLVHVEVLGGVDFVEADAKECLAKIDELTGARPACHCVDIRNVKSIARGCRDIFSNGPNTLAAALIVSSPLSRVVGNIFLGLSKARYPLRLFGDEQSALAWLHTLRAARE